MADTPAPAPQVADDPFDLGDTGINLTSQTPEPVKKTPPKGPDGKFISPAAAEPPAPKHPSALVSQAIDFGMDEELIGTMSTPALYRTVNLFLTRERELSRSFATQQSLEGARVAQPAPPPPPAVEADPLDALVGEGFDQRLVDAIKAAKKAPLEELKTLRAEREQEKQQVAQSAIAEGVALLDAAFAKLADPRFGEGTGAELAKDPAKAGALKRRMALVRDIGITDVRQVSRLTIMKQLRTARDLIFGEAAAATPTEANPYAANGTPPITREEWDQGGVAKPSQRNGSPELKGDALAIKNLAEKMRQREAQFSDEAELEGLPD